MLAARELFRGKRAEAARAGKIASATVHARIIPACAFHCAPMIIRILIRRNPLPFDTAAQRITVL